MEDIKIKKYNYNNSKLKNTILKLKTNPELKIYYKSRINIFKKIDIENLIGIIYGPRTITFSNVKECIPQLCLSLVLRNRTYDLEFNNLEEIINLCEKLRNYNPNLKIPDNIDMIKFKYNWINNNLSNTDFFDKYKLWISTFISIENLRIKEDINIEKNDFQCSICIDNIADNELFITKCRHYFHIECIKLWMKESNSCPNCRLK